MRWFGESWGAAVCEDAGHMETPVGTPCAECKNPLGNQSRGFEIPLYRADLPPINQYYHRFCLLKQILPGALNPDPDVPSIHPVDEMKPPSD